VEKFSRLEYVYSWALENVETNLPVGSPREASGFIQTVYR
jgi:hypothetical protein